MRKFIQNKLKDQKGLTLIELLAVIVILAIIAAIAIPAIGNIIQNSRNGAAKADFQNALASANIYFTENPEETSVVLADLEGTYLDDAGSLESATVNNVDGGSNTISGTSDPDGDGTIDYTITTAITNEALSAIKNADFTGTIN